jgi:predicted nuclease of predicted toxin-antitoxin system
VERQIVERLRQAGHEVLYIAEMEPGIDDDMILAQANARQALLVTLDKDFGELVYRQGLVHAGVILLRLAGLSPETKASLVAQVMQQRGREMVQAFSVVSPGIVRIRKQRT